MDQLTCTNCKVSSQSDAGIPVCPACGTPNPNHPTNAAAPLTETAAAGATTAATSTPTPQTAVDPPAPVAAPAAPAAPAESTLDKVEKAAEKILELVAAESPVIGTMFGGVGPIGAILKLLGPTAAIGAAVLRQHLTTEGFDLSKLQTIDPVK